MAQYQSCVAIVGLSMQLVGIVYGSTVGGVGTFVEETISTATLGTGEIVDEVWMSGTYGIEGIIESFSVATVGADLSAMVATIVPPLLVLIGSILVAAMYIPLLVELSSLAQDLQNSLNQAERPVSQTILYQEIELSVHAMLEHVSIFGMAVPGPALGQPGAGVSPNLQNALNTFLTAFNE